MSYPRAEALVRREDTIVALSTPPGVGAIALIRLSGKDAFSYAQAIFSGKKLREQPSHTAHFGRIKDQEGQIVDEVVLTLYRSPHSFTKEDVVEISCHGSDYIVSQIIQLLLAQGARLALPGEFTQRAYLNGQMDLAQAEAIADLINADTEAAHRVAMQQMRGGYSQKIRDLREDFVQLAALLELELDFSEEDVEFANRDELYQQVHTLKQSLTELKDSFTLGNALKNGVPVAIIGKPNAGKSTLLNALLEEEKAIVTDIPGTTRDTIEDEKTIRGIKFRFIDTAGLRETEDVVEKIGVERTKATMQNARIIIYLFDALAEPQQEANEQARRLQEELPETKILVVANKTDEFARFDLFLPEGLEGTAISAKEKEGLDRLSDLLYQSVASEAGSDLIVTNLRHYESLQHTLAALEQVENSMALGLSTELIASDIREAIHHLGSIVGEVNNEEVLGYIFGKFCIGK